MSVDATLERSSVTTSQPRHLAGRSTVAGWFHDREHTAYAVENLKATGFSPDDAGVAMRDRPEEDVLAPASRVKAASRPVGGWDVTI